MAKPIFTDYVELIHTLFGKQVCTSGKKKAKRGHPFDFKDKSFLTFFVWMQMCNITEFKAQHRWLRHHPEARQSLNFKRLPHRTTMLGRSLLCCCIKVV